MDQQSDHKFLQREEREDTERRNFTNKDDFYYILAFRAIGELLRNFYVILAIIFVLKSPSSSLIYSLVLKGPIC